MGDERGFALIAALRLPGVLSRVGLELRLAPADRRLGGRAAGERGPEGWAARGEPVEARVNVDVTYWDKDYEQVGQESKLVDTSRGTALLRISPPAKAVRTSIDASSGDAGALELILEHVQHEPVAAVADGVAGHLEAAGQGAAGHFAQGVGAGQHHDDAVEAQGDAAGRWSAVFERVQEKAEA